jgi:hypothetical protein
MDISGSPRMRPTLNSRYINLIFLNPYSQKPINIELFFLIILPNSGSSNQ